MDYSNFNAYRGCLPVGRLNKTHNHAHTPEIHGPAGVCDCCDGSDEKKGVCANTCKEEQARYAEEAQRQYQLVMEGTASVSRGLGRLTEHRSNLTRVHF